MNVDDVLIIEWLDGHAPVQAEGTICGQRFHFRARWDGWCLSVSEKEELDPIDINLPEQGFYREGDFGKPGGFDASYMPDEAAIQIIRQCAEEFIAYMHSN